MRVNTGALISFLIFSAVAVAQNGRKIYLDPNDSFSPYFSSALQKKDVPITVTTDQQQADYTATFRAKDSNGSIVQGIASAVNQGWWNSGAFNEVAMSIVDTKTKDVKFSYTCKKHNRYSGADQRMASSVAECLAKHWESSLAR